MSINNVFSRFGLPNPHTGKMNTTTSSRTNSGTTSSSTTGFFSGMFTPSTNGLTETIGQTINTSTIARIASYFFAILIVIGIILLFVHFVFKIPIFKLQAGAPGKILIPGFDDGSLYWNKVNPGQIKSKDLPIQNASYNYSMILDVFIQNPMQFSNHPRVLFTRGATYKSAPSGDSLMGLLDNYNLAIALLPDTSDLLVSVLNKDNNMENVLVPNIPIQEPFRLGVIVMEKALEVYLNGHLIKTRTFQTTPKDVTGDIFPAQDVEATIAKLRNLKIWPHIITTAEVRYATPALSTTAEIGGGPMPSSSMCASSTDSSTTKTV